MRHVQNVEVGYANTIFESLMSTKNVKGLYLQVSIDQSQQQVVIVQLAKGHQQGANM